MSQEKVNIENSKEFSTAKIIYLVIFLLIVGMVILLGSDTFNSPTVNPSVGNNTGQANDQHVHNGADLSKLEEIKTLEETVAADPSNSDALLKLGHLLNDSGFYEKAIERYKSYLKMKPNEPDVIVDMGVCYYQLGDTDSAIKTMESAIKIKPDHQIANFNLGIVNSAAGNHDKAIEWWKKAVKIDPNSNIGKKAKDLLENH
ncbi:MAG: tetratricopeptide repeat protein [Chlorobi bacterium]|nr:tetratricopeptide repeat protein [Chlorobiota bacterium]